MIQDEVDPVIDFSWFYFVGRTRLRLTFKETGRLTLNMFLKLYKHYKDMFDAELVLQRSGTTYAEAEAKAYQRETSWF